MGQPLMSPEDIKDLFSYTPWTSNSDSSDSTIKFTTHKSKNMASYSYQGPPNCRDDTKDAQLQRDGDFCLKMLQCTEGDLIVVSDC